MPWNTAAYSSIVLWQPQSILPLSSVTVIKVLIRFRLQHAFMAGTGGALWSTMWKCISSWLFFLHLNECLWAATHWCQYNISAERIEDVDWNGVGLCASVHPKSDLLEGGRYSESVERWLLFINIVFICICVFLDGVHRFAARTRLCRGLGFTCSGEII